MDSSTPLKNYQPAEIEKKWNKVWGDAAIFKANAQSQKDPFCLMLPPPNVTGFLHMGHAFQHTIMDVICRYERMSGKEVLWQPGTDHAGIATQMVVERKLDKQGIKRQDLGRDEFVKKVWDWRHTSGGAIENQMQQMGLSVDWSLKKFTLDEDYYQAIVGAFVKLYEDGLIYQAQKLINWDPKLKTAISDLEVENRAEMGVLYTVHYPLIEADSKVSENNFVAIATTRPETILADGAIAFHPNDERFIHLRGRKARVPMTERNIPIIEDSYVKPEFGTGCVKITPAHDYNDYDVGTRHQMEVINLFNDDATMNENAPKRYQGLDRFKARDKVVADLKECGLLIAQKPHQYQRPYSERTQVVVEPYLSKQWFLDTSTLAKLAKEMVVDGEIEMVPSVWKKTYFNWLNDTRDWCISRQLWWGHRIPAWFDEEGNCFVATDEKGAYEKAKQFWQEKGEWDKKIELHQDDSVLDTWFSSAFWPMATLGWPKENQPAFDKFFPTSTLVTGFDIIFFWVARMVMMSAYFLKKPPFKTIYITGLIRDSDGQKMSKVKGNVIDPLDVVRGISFDDLVKKRTASVVQKSKVESIRKLTQKNFPQGIEAMGVDAMRMGFLSQATFGRDICFDIQRIGGYRNFANKLFNATKFCLMVVDKFGIDEAHFKNPSHHKDLSVFEKWILCELDQTIEKTTQGFKSYRFDLAASEVYHFVWGQFCDWYLEMIKPSLYQEDNNLKIKRQITTTTLWVLVETLKLIHPKMPYLSDELFDHIKEALNKTSKGVLGDKNSISLLQQNFPKVVGFDINLSQKEKVLWLQSLLKGLRQFKHAQQMEPKRKIRLEVINPSLKVKAMLGDETFLTTLKKMAYCDDESQESSKNSLVLVSEKEEGVQKVSFVVQGENLNESTRIRVLPSIHQSGAKQGGGLIEEQTEKRVKKRIAKQKAKLEGEIEFFNQKLANHNFVAKAPQSLVEQTRQKLAKAKEELEALNL